MIKLIQHLTGLHWRVTSAICKFPRGLAKLQRHTPKALSFPVTVSAAQSRTCPASRPGRCHRQTERIAPPRNGLENSQEGGLTTQLAPAARALTAALTAGTFVNCALAKSPGFAW
jgi:hypothetical protein